MCETLKYRKRTKKEILNDKKLKYFFDNSFFSSALETGIDKKLNHTLIKKLSFPEERAKWLEQMLSGDYQIAPPKQAEIPKKDGGKRIVYVNTDIDRLFLSLYNNIIFKMYGDKIHEACKSYQKGIGCASIVKEISQKISSMNSDIVGYKIDLQKYFDSVNLSLIDEALNEISTDSVLDDIVYNYYHSNKVYDTKGNLIEKYTSLKQGCAFASFLANYLLRDVDQKISEMNVIYCRYSDDILIIGEDSHKALNELKKMLSKKGLTLHPNKTEELTKEKYFTFLGFSIKNENITFSKDAIKTFQKEIEKRTINSKYNLNKMIKEVNKYLYSGYIDGSKEFSWGIYYLKTINVDEDINTLNCFVMDAIRASSFNKTKIGGLGVNLTSNKPKKNGIIIRGIGKNVSSNMMKWEQKYGQKNIEGYLSLKTMQNALKNSKSIYSALLNDSLLSF